MARLAFLIPNLKIGGAERVAMILIQGLLERGHEVDLVVMSAEGELLEHVPQGAMLFDLKAPRLRNVVRPLVAYLRMRRPAAMQVRMWPLTVMAVIASRLARVKVRLVLSDHSILSRQFGRRAARRWLGPSIRYFYPKAAVRVAISGAVADDLAKLSGLDRDRFEVIHNPIAQPPSGFVHRGGGGRHLVSIGTLKPDKNHALLLRAFRLLVDRAPATLTIVGEGSERAALERLVQELALGGSVSMPGAAIDVWPTLASADLFVLASDREGFGNVIVEAMAAGVPVVSTDTDGAREALAGGQYGTLVPRGDPSALAAAIEDALAAPADPRVLQARAGQYMPDIAVGRYQAALCGTRNDLDLR